VRALRSCLSVVTHVVLGVLALAVQPEQSHGQMVTGTIRESGTDSAIPGVQLVLVDEEGKAAATALTDDRGLFTLLGPAPGTYIVSLKRVGYRPLAVGPLRLDATDTLEVMYDMRRLAVELEPVVVQTVRVIRYLQNVGFYERRQKERGHFIGPAEIEEEINRARQFTDLLRGIPGVTITQQGVKLPGMQAGPSARTCSTPHIYIDGTLVHDRYMGRDFILNDVIHPEVVRAIEIYRRPAELPPQYGGAEAACGVLLIWTGSRIQRY